MIGPGGGVLVKWLIVASLLWPLLLATAVRQHREAPTAWSAVVYLAASRICHQRDERSFHSDGVKWPVCGRCSGLYAAAPLGAIAAAFRRRRQGTGRFAVLLGLAALPTALTLGAEWLELSPVSNVARAWSAVPLGAAVMFAIVGVTRGTPAATPSRLPA